jgi:Flp pilus assembly protein TadG
MKGLIQTLIKTGRRAGAERGGQMIEMAICLPILLILFAVAGEIGRFYFMNANLAKGTRLAARYLTTTPLNTNENIALYHTNAKNLVVYGKIAPNSADKPIAPGLAPNDVLISTTGGTSFSPQFITVQITNITFTPLLNLGRLLKNPNFSLAAPLTSSTTMRYLITQPLN